MNTYDNNFDETVFGLKGMMLPLLPSLTPSNLTSAAFTGDS